MIVNQTPEYSADWISKTTHYGDVYYENQITKETTWIKPPEMEPVSNPAACPPPLPDRTAARPVAVVSGGLSPNGVQAAATGTAVPVAGGVVFQQSAFSAVSDEEDLRCFGWGGFERVMFLLLLRHLSITLLSNTSMPYGWLIFLKSYFEARYLMSEVALFSSWCCLRLNEKLLFLDFVLSHYYTIGCGVSTGHNDPQKQLARSKMCPPRNEVFRACPHASSRLRESAPKCF